MDIRTCKVCNQTKCLNEFETVKGKYRKWTCKECRLAYFNEYNENRKKFLIDYAKAKRRENVKRMLDYLKSHPCVDCGESDPVVLEFDHVRGDKSWNLSERIHSSTPWARIEEEIAKCDVRCSNCHKRRTAKVRGWYSELA